MVKNIKYIIYDVGGVLLDWKSGLRVVANKLSVPEQELLDFLLQYLDDLELGNITDDIFWKATKEHFKTVISAIELGNLWVTKQSRIDAGWNLVYQTQKMGYPLGIFTNNWLGVMENLIKNNNDFRLFSFIFDSSQEKCKKPEPKAYTAVMGALGLEPKDILFIDDNESNINTAKETGWNTFLYKGDLDSINSQIMLYLE